MKETLLSTLRDRSISQSQFRKAADHLAHLMATETASAVKKNEHSIVIIPILRAGIALLPAFMTVFNDAHVGFLGVKRDEKTAIPFQYYASIPKISPDEKILILDPMIATGGSANLAIDNVLQKGATPSNIHLIGVLASLEGIDNILHHHPKTHIHVVAKDKTLDARKYIVPGLGDFGDRYFGIAT